MSVVNFELDDDPQEGTRRQGLGEAIRFHRSARLKIDRAVDASAKGDISEDDRRRLDCHLEEAVEGEEAARLAFLKYPVTDLADVRAKARHVLLLLTEGDELDKTELQFLLLSMM